MAEGIHGGRAVREGYQRGWSLQFDGLGERLRQEALYRRSSAPDKHFNLYLLMTRFLPKLASRNVIEFGSYKGGNALFMALVMREVDPAARVYALDTFEGMPVTDGAVDMHTQGNFSDSNFDYLKSRIAALGLTNLILVKGLFQHTFPELVRAGAIFGLAHIDADIHSAVKYAQDAVWPQMTPGGYVVYDDADVSSCIGATQAVEELIMERRVHSEQIWPHFVFRAGLA